MEKESAIKIHRRILTGVALLPIASACSSDGTVDPEPSEPISTASEEVVNGLPDAENMPDVVNTVGKVNINGVYGDNAYCSATLVGRNHLLTAAHCICNRDYGVDSATFYLPQDGGYWYDVADWVVHPEWQSGCHTFFAGGPRAADLAVLTLSTAVPESVVEEPAEVSLLPIGAHAGNDVGFVVGFGGTVSYDSSEGGGYRRHGILGNSVKLRKDPCDYFETSHCNDEWEWEMTISDSGRAIASGDSGGPLIQSTPGPYYYVVGVASGHYQDKDFLANEKAPVSVWAPTGSGTGVSPDNVTFIMDAMGGDPDGDGVPEANDNCPASFCAEKGVPIEYCKNSVQLDVDNDGWGDEYCDNCKPNDCLNLHMFPSATMCHNPSQKNSDSDHWGDRCDTCPEDNVPLADSDGDFVGDACDNCNGTEFSYASCLSDADCALPGQGKCLTERMSDGTTQGHCSGQADVDSDGLGDACDSCPDIATPQGERNANTIAEFTEDVQQLADVCDRVPVARFDHRNVPEYDLPPVQGDGEGADDVASIRGLRFLVDRVPTREGPQT